MLVSGPVRLPRAERILLIKLREIGDLLLTTPAVRAVRSAYPRSYLAMLVNSGTEEVVQGNPDLDEVLVFERGWKNLPFLERCWREGLFVAQVRKRRFDVVFDFTGGDRAAIVALFSGARVRVSYDFNRGFWGKRYLYTHQVEWGAQIKHMVEHSLDLVRPFIPVPAGYAPFMPCGREDRERVTARLEEAGAGGDGLRVHVHPTSKWFFKCWRDEAVAEVIDYLAGGLGAQVIVTSGPAAREVEKASRIVSICRHRPLNWAGRTTLKDLAALSGACHLFLGVDTGPMHIAAAVGTPVIALFGPSGEHQWGPWGEEHTVVAQPFPCRPCGQDGCYGSKRSECLEMIPAFEVKRAVDRVLLRRGFRLRAAAPFGLSPGEEMAVQQPSAGEGIR
ncbi:MAG: putative lipopolysaccharide heptosyltransferase III [Candidatus Tectomicrobia bacterium]|uniref:Lipopolysaccharide heptosyltransferase III n=1 Tax=Tectimicrobiota bacterium TaxID=2528274 RepID=A0A932GSC4_UNCTE|nr:putative lipopolysaccharide heptosyltransferase III [Candidatus Tectomicrobia bacterium]